MCGIAGFWLRKETGHEPTEASSSSKQAQIQARQRLTIQPT